MIQYSKPLLQTQLPSPLPMRWRTPVHSNTLQHNTIQYKTAQCNRRQHKTSQDNATQCNVMKRYEMLWHVTATVHCTTITCNVHIHGCVYIHYVEREGERYHVEGETERERESISNTQRQSYIHIGLCVQDHTYASVYLAYKLIENHINTDQPMHTKTKTCDPT